MSDEAARALYDELPQLSSIAMALIDDLLPSHQFSEVHCCRVAAEPATIINAVPDYRPDDDRLFKIAIALRELPMQLLRKAEDRPPPFGFDNFTLIGRSETEIVYGLVGQFWRFDFGLRTIADGAAFVAFADPSCAKLVLGFSAVPDGDGQSVLTTETRVFCPDRETRRKFLPYWLVIRPVSGLIRRRILAAIKAASE